MSLTEIISEILRLQKAVNAFYPGLSNPEPGPPASEAELRQLDDFFATEGLATPPSLREALAGFNGVPHLYAEDFGLLSVAQILRGPAHLTDEAREAFPSATRILIGGGRTLEFMGLDLDRPGPEGEFGVLSVTVDLHPAAATSLRAYLETLHATLTDTLASERRDREGLPDN